MSDGATGTHGGLALNAGAAITGTNQVRVAVAAPLAKLFDYRVPPACQDLPLRPGMRVEVPFGRGARVGVVTAIDVTTDVDQATLKPIRAILDNAPILRAQDLDFILWAADYYQCPPGEALFTALPARLRKAQPLIDPRPQGWRLTMAGGGLMHGGLSRARRQREAIDLLAGAPGGLDDRQLRDALGQTASTLLRTLAAKGLIERCRITPERSPPETSARGTTLTSSTSATASGEKTKGPALNAEQAAAVRTVQDHQGFGCFLLDGITGSGKTEVYLRLIELALTEGRQVLVLVPEIGLTPQLYQRFAARLDAPMAVLHSGLNNKARELEWQRAAQGIARLVIGTRSAIFTPLTELGLLIVDEEHDASLKQQDGFRYSARDLAVRLAQLNRCPILLGSATPSLESLRNAQLGRYQHLHLSARAGDAMEPRILVADIRSQPLDTGLSHALLTHMERELEAGNQVLVFLNRRGFSPVLTCHDCGWVGDCRHCDAHLTLHRARHQLHCHHCGATQPLPNRCPYCQSQDLRPLGQGTERVEDSLRQRFPGIPLARIDRDSTRRKGELERQLAAAERGETRILLGTQMLAKGHHLPGITLVGILDLDQGLYGADFRATERMAQLLVQVAGRAGRADRHGTVLLQTRHPDHPMLTRLLRDGYGAFAQVALAEREAAGLPPYGHQALLRADSIHEADPMEFLERALEMGRPLATRTTEFWGPAPAQMERRAGRIRAQLLIQAPERVQLQRLLRSWVPALRELKRPSRLRWSLDVDPQDTY